MLAVFRMPFIFYPRVVLRYNSCWYKYIYSWMFFSLVANVQYKGMRTAGFDSDIYIYIDIVSNMTQMKTMAQTKTWLCCALCLNIIKDPSDITQMKFNQCSTV